MSTARVRSARTRQDARCAAAKEQHFLDFHRIHWSRSHMRELATMINV